MSKALRPLWLLLPVFVVIFISSYLTPYFGNDYRYLLVQGTDELVGSISDIFISQYRHYFEWGGRTVNHLLAQFLLYIGKPWQSIIQAFTFCAVVYMMAALGTGTLRPSKQRLSALIFAFLMLWLCLRNFGEVVINVVSSCNYLYSTLIVMCFLLPFRQSLLKFEDQRSLGFSLFMFPLGVCAGWTNENTGFAVVTMVGLYNLKLLFERRLSLWQFMGGVGLLCGYLLLMLAPGNHARFENMEDRGFDYVQHFFNSGIEVVALCFAMQHLLLISLCAVLYKLRVHELLHLDKGQVRAGLWLCAIGFLSLLIMLASPTVPARSSAPFTMLAGAGVIALYQELYLRGIRVLPRAVLNTILIIACPVVLFTAFNMTQAYLQAHFDNKVRGMEIMAQLSQGRKDIVVHPLNVKTTRYVYIADARTNQKYWANLILAKYYRVNSFARLCDYPTDDFPEDLIFIQKLGRPVCQVR